MTRATIDNRALALDSASVNARLAQASVLASDGDGEGAYRAAIAAQRLAPGNADVAVELGDVLMQLERDADDFLLRFADLQVTRAAHLERAPNLSARIRLEPGTTRIARTTVSMPP